MVFSSLLFVFLFLALNLVSQAALRGARQKNIAMLLFSLVFFSWAGPRYVVLLLLDTALCWFFAICIEREPQRKKLHLSLCVALVLLVLGIFKYTGFLMGNLQSLFGWPEVIPQIVLPIGISFYTFQLISYVVDVYRGEVRAQKKYWILLLYASLFHQCIAGPIVRYRDVAQDLAKRQVHTEEVSRGVSRFTVGLAKKAVLANSVAVLADRWLPMTTEGLAKIPTAGLWLGGLCYMLQIYLDFSAYSDMAIGMGLMCGFHYKENFNYPYIASSVTDFWRRWHISLSTFFRDYVYIPLGGNRRGKGRQLLNLFIVWGLTGLWHGASWNYVLWGLYFFLFLVIEKFLLGEKQQRIPAVLRHLFLLIIVYFCWVIFRFRDAAALGMALIGAPVLRLKSDYLAIATLGFAEILRAVIQWEKLGPLTNASNILRKFTGYDSILFPFIVSGVCIAIIVLLINSTYGRAFKAIREDEIAAEAMGINLMKHKMLSFCTSSFFAGIGGALLAMFQFNAHAKNFTTAMTYEILLIVVIGGIGSITGSVLGSFLYVACSEWWLRFLDNPTIIGTFKVPLLGHGFRMVVFSVVIMVIVLFYRQGLMGTKEFSWDAIFAFFGKIGRFFKNLFAGQKAVKGGAANE